MNLNESIPNEFYVFVNKYDPLTQHNIKNAKAFISGAFSQLNFNNEFLDKYLNNTVDYLPFIPNENLDLQFISKYSSSMTSSYRLEYQCEIFRKTYFPSYPSRLSCIYAFGSIEDCELVSRKYNWDLSSVRKFRLSPNALNKVVKVNMEVISLMRRAMSISMIYPETEKNIWTHYWTSRGDFSMELPTIETRKLYNSGVVWEYLIEGQLELI